MPISTITQTISTIPEAGRRGIDVQTVFVNKQEDFQDHLQGTTVTELNTLKTQMNTMAGEMNTTASQVNTDATTASTSATTATTKASEASASASQALTSRNQAETFKNSASASATTASTKASEASASATTASASATTASASATTASTKASEASASATSASTKASEASASATTASTKASEASASATTASTKASEASASATSASASASNALASRNQAEIFAQQAQASATSVDVNNIVHRTNDESIAGVKTFSSTIAGSINGNSGTATKLATARTITIGNTSKTFDGSNNVSWTLNEIGASITDSVTTTSSVIGASATAVKTAYDMAVSANGANTFSAGTNLEAHSLPVVKATGTTFKKVKEICVANSGIVTVSFRGRATYGDSAYACVSQIYKNGSAVGTVRTNGTENFVTYTENINVNAGDLIQLYIRQNLAVSLDYPVQAESFKILVSNPTTSNVII